jgi:5-methylcytosine-specific restriction protein B
LSIYKELGTLFLSIIVNENDVAEIEYKVATHKKEEFIFGNQKSFLLHIPFSDLIDKEIQEFLFEKWLNACKSYFSPAQSCPYRNSHSNDLYEMVVSNDLRKKYLSAANTNQILLERYKNIIRETHLKQELYKWEKVQQFQGRPNTEAVDFQQELKNIQFENLIYQIAKSVMLSLAKEKTEEYRACMKKLFDETQPLENRVTNFVSEADNLYNQISPLNTSHHDERTIATLLTYKYPEKYAFYKDSFYQKYCKLLNIPTEKKNKKYVHYLELLQDLKENFLQKDAELLEIVKGFLPENNYADTSLNILAQDILYQVLDRELDINNTTNQTVPFSQIAQGVIEKLKADKHPLGNHQWSNTPKSNFAYCSVNPQAAIKPFPVLHYEILGYENGLMNFELHPEVQKINRTETDTQKLNSFFKRSENELLVLDKWAIAGGKNNCRLRFRTPVDLKNISNEGAVEKLAKMAKIMYDKIQEPLIQFLINENLAYKYIPNYNHSLSNSDDNSQQNTNNMPKHPLNQILYGPPGTGKTYNTINEALAIIEGKDTQSLENEDRKELTDRYKKYVEAGQIMFTTFHQSMSYEDFIEGIKPETDDKNKPETGEKGQVTYNVKDGIFKLICEKAYTTKSAPNFEEVYQLFVIDKFENNFELKTQFRQAPFDVEVSQKGDCYSISRGEKKTRTGYSKKTIQDYLVNGTKLPYSDPYFYPICDYIKNNYPFEVIDAEVQPHVLIIDEINRGNVSQIFGELITLIEDSKRKGESEELEIILPYSKEIFSVPNNLYIIGTMNTADRSVEALDTALRRRFIFKEMPAKPELLSVDNLLKTILAKTEKGTEITDLELEVARIRARAFKKLYLNDKEAEQKPQTYKFIFEVIDFSELLTSINQRLSALLSKDHTIGHAYFISCHTQKELETVFYQKIIPLLQEYFYGDLSKIEWIIGEDFVKVEEVKTDIFMRSKEKPYSLPKKVVFEKPKDFLLSIKKIYENN